MEINPNISQTHRPMPEPTAPWSIELGSGLGPVPLRTSTGTPKRPSTNWIQILVEKWMEHAPSLLHDQTFVMSMRFWALAQPHLMSICLWRLGKLYKGLEVRKCMPLSTGKLEFVFKQPVPVNETNKDVRAMYQRYGHAPIGREAIQHAPFPWGKCWLHLKLKDCILWLPSY